MSPRRGLGGPDRRADHRFAALARSTMVGPAVATDDAQRPQLPVGACAETELPLAPRGALAKPRKAGARAGGADLGRSRRQDASGGQSPSSGSRLRPRGHAIALPPLCKAILAASLGRSTAGSPRLLPVRRATRGRAVLHRTRLPRARTGIRLDSPADRLGAPPRSIIALEEGDRQWSFVVGDDRVSACNRSRPVKRSLSQRHGERGDAECAGSSPLHPPCLCERSFCRSFRERLTERLVVLPQPSAQASSQPSR